jgi:hypothetical protein
LSLICKSLTLYHIILSSSFNLSLAICCSASSPKICSLSVLQKCPHCCCFLLLFGSLYYPAYEVWHFPLSHQFQCL